MLLSVTLPHGLFPIYPMVQFIVMKRHETGLLSLGRKLVEKKKIVSVSGLQEHPVGIVGKCWWKIDCLDFFCRGHESGIAFGNNWCWDFLASQTSQTWKIEKPKKLKDGTITIVKCLRIIITWNIFSEPCKNWNNTRTQCSFLLQKIQIPLLLSWDRRW